MRIAIFDYLVTRTSPIGSCHLRLLEGLRHEHDFVVFASEFDNPDPDRIEFVRIPVPRRPALALYVGYHALAPLYYARYLAKTKRRFDLVQTVETNLGFGDLAYSHFCHRVFVRDHWSEFSGEYRGNVLRSSAVWLVHWLHAELEPHFYRKVPKIIVPSAGLAREMKREYPETNAKIEIVPNAIDAARMTRPASFRRDEERQKLGLHDEDFALAFVALGHFERKGLPLVLEAMQHIRDSHLKLIVVGGEFDVLWQYRARARELGLEERVIFAGKTADVRRFLWCSDGFVLPSCYEVFPLVVLEAAAAGIPIVVSRMNGVEDFLVDGANGILVDRSAEGVADGIRRLRGLAPADRARMGSRATEAVGSFGTREFVERWREVYRRAEEATALSGPRSLRNTRQYHA